MRVFNSMNCKSFFPSVLLLVIATLPHTSQAQQNWNATVGGQSKDMARQAVAFLPSEIWIHAGDGITWKFASGDIHSVTFLTVGQVYPLDFTQGCPPITPSGSPFDGSSCVSSAPLVLGQTYQVIFPKAGNYEIVCLVHAEMFGVIHVLDPALPLPHDRGFYDKQAEAQLKALLEDADRHQHHAEHEHSIGDMLSASVSSGPLPQAWGRSEQPQADNNRFPWCALLTVRSRFTRVIRWSGAIWIRNSDTPSHLVPCRRTLSTPHAVPTVP